MAGLTVLPISLNLLGPVSITFPGIQRRIDTAATTARRRCFGYPPAILLPTIRIRIISGACLVAISLGDFLCRRIVIPGPSVVFAILHVNVLAQSFEER